MLVFLVSGTFPGGTHTEVVIFRGRKRLRPNQLHMCSWLG